jgi:hypothetical protein
VAGVAPAAARKLLQKALHEVEMSLRDELPSRQLAEMPTREAAPPEKEPQRWTAWLAISDSNFDVQRENSSL